MNAQAQAASGCILARPDGGALERRLAQFHSRYETRVRVLAARHAWISDLALTFPALLFALAAPRKDVDANAAVRLAMSGAPLARIALAAGVPMWMRCFPPQAFTNPIQQLPDGLEFRRRIANHLPAKWSLASRWIKWLAHAARWGDDEIAVWFAREAPLKKPKRTRSRYLRSHHQKLVCLWAWFSGRKQERAGACIATPWRPDMRWKAAKEAAHAWQDAVQLRLYLGEGETEDVWLEGGEVDGYSFLALRSAEAVDAEAQAMKHCVGSYGSRISGNDCRLFSVRKDGLRIATLELQPGYPEGPFPAIVELAGERSASVPREVWIAARRWLHAQDVSRFDAERLKYRLAKFDARVWRAYWRSFWLAKRAVPAWLPLAPSETAFYEL